MFTHGAGRRRTARSPGRQAALIPRVRRHRAAGGCPVQWAPEGGARSVNGDLPAGDQLTGAADAAPQSGGVPPVKRARIYTTIGALLVSARSGRVRHRSWVRDRCRAEVTVTRRPVCGAGRTPAYPSDTRHHLTPVRATSPRPRRRRRTPMALSAAGWQLGAPCGNARHPCSQRTCRRARHPPGTSAASCGSRAGGGALHRPDNGPPRPTGRPPPRSRRHFPLQQSRRAARRSSARRLTGHTGPPIRRHSPAQRPA